MSFSWRYFDDDKLNQIFISFIFYKDIGVLGANFNFVFHKIKRKILFPNFQKRQFLSATKGMHKIMMNFVLILILYLMVCLLFQSLF